MEFRTGGLVAPVVAVSLAGVIAGACSRSDTARSASPAVDTTAVAARPAATGAGTGAAGGAAAAQGLTDANIVYILDQANAADSARGTLAASKGTRTDVRNFGKLMAGEHHALRAEGQALAKRLGVTPQAPAGDQSQAQAKQEMDSLTALPRGAAWDRAYIDYEVGYHRAVIGTATTALGAAQNPQLKALIRTAAPVLQHHLQRAEQIQKKLGA